MFNIHLLPASFGDAILIEYGTSKPRYILIDGGPYFANTSVLSGIQRVAPGLKTIDLLVITHIDIDHIDGIIVLLNQEKLPFKIKEVWYNGYKEMEGLHNDMLGALQGEMLSVLIDQKKLVHNKVTKGKAIVVQDYDNLPEFKLTGGLKITLLAPGVEGLLDLYPKWKEEIVEIGDVDTVAARLSTDFRYKELPDDLLGEMTIEQMQMLPETADTSKANGSSIGFIIEYKGKRCMLAGDVPTHYLLTALEPFRQKSGVDRLFFDAWKLAHHGSKKSNLSALMQIISSPRILVSSDGKRYKHPDAACLAKLLKFNVSPFTFYFNYLTTHNEMWAQSALQHKYNYEAQYPDNETGEGVTVSLGD